MKIEEIPVGKIKVKERFRTDLGSLKELIESIKEKGLIQPITVDPSYNLLAGGRRLAACKEAGLKTISVITRKVIGELDAREIELIENVHRKEMSWSERALLEQRIFKLKKEKDPSWSMRQQGKEMDHSHTEVGRRLELAEALDVIPELRNAPDASTAWKILSKAKEDLVIKEMMRKSNSDLSKSVKHAESHYIIGDSIKGMGKISNGICSFAEVDPPYAIEIDRRKSRATRDTTLKNYTEIDEKDYPDILKRSATEVHRILGDNSFAVWWFAMGWYSEVLDTLRQVGFKVSDVPCIWYKVNPGQTASPDTMLGSAYEPFFVCRKGMPKLRKAGRSNVFEYPPVRPSIKIHSTEKPIELLDEIVQTFAYPGARIIVPFLGSGVTLRAAYKNNMTGFGYDLDDTLKARFLNRVHDDILEKESESGESSSE